MSVLAAVHSLFCLQYQATSRQVWQVVGRGKETGREREREREMDQTHYVLGRGRSDSAVWVGGSCDIRKSEVASTMEHLSIAPARLCCSSSSSCSASAPHERRRRQHQERGAGSQQEERKELAGKRVPKSPSAKSPTSTNNNTREGKVRQAEQA